MMNRRSTTFITIAVTALMVAGCSSSAGSTHSGHSDGQKAGSANNSSITASSAACVATAQTVLDKASQRPELDQVPRLTGLSSLSGKTVWWIGNLSLGISTEQLAGIKQAMSAADINVKTFDGASQTPKNNQGIEEAIAAHAAAIIITAIKTESVTPALRDAADAHIPILSVFEAPSTDDAKRAIKDTLLLDNKGHGEAMAAWAIVTNHCKVDAALLYRPVFSVSQDELTAIQNYYKTTCPDTCKVQGVQYDVTTQATALGTLAVNTANRDPKLNAIMLDGDDSADFVTKALEAAGKSVKMISLGGTAPALAQVAAKNQSLTADIANVPNNFVGWMIADTTLLMIQGQPAALGNLIPTRLLDTDNIPASAAEYFNLGDYQGRFKAAWGVS